jgi:hypothetical protein
MEGKNKEENKETIKNKVQYCEADIENSDML